jgi:hypothetical protein
MRNALCIKCNPYDAMPHFLKWHFHMVHDQMLRVVSYEDRLGGGNLACAKNLTWADHLTPTHFLD